MKLARTVCAAALGMALVSSTITPVVARGFVTKNIVFVHGAWADGSSWSKVIPILEALVAPVAGNGWT